MDAAISVPAVERAASANEPNVRSRRMVLGAFAGAVAAVVGQAVARATPVTATNGDHVTAGNTFSATATTGVTTSSGNGIQGLSADGGASGVYGENTTTGPGVAGYSHDGFGVSGYSPGSVGVVARSDSGIALQTVGRVAFKTSGLTEVPTAAKSTVINPQIGAGGFSMEPAIILCTLESNQAGLGIQRVAKNVTAKTFKVVLTDAVVAGKTAKVGWLVIG
jgi:hypothetical protein